MTADQPQSTRVRRPLGLSMAIIMSAIIYGIFPLFPALLVLWTKASRPNSIGTDLIGGASGWFMIGVSVLILIGCVLAWIGRPAWSRWPLIALVWLDTILLMYRVYQNMTAPPCLSEQCTDLTTISLPTALCSGVMILAVALYITWYMNRAPARAFYQR